MAESVSAQPGPLVTVEHDWRIQIGNYHYGLTQVKWLGTTKGSRITIWFGRNHLTFYGQASWLIASILLPTGALVSFLFTRRRGRIQDIGHSLPKP